MCAFEYVVDIYQESFEYRQSFWVEILNVTFRKMSVDLQIGPRA